MSLTFRVLVVAFQFMGDCHPQFTRKHKTVYIDRGTYIFIGIGLRSVIIHLLSSNTICPSPAKIYYSKFTNHQNPELARLAW